MKMTCRGPRLPELFLHPFIVESRAPFQRHLNCLEVEIGREDYRHLLQIELLTGSGAEIDLSTLQDITERLQAMTQNAYNRTLLQQLGARIYHDVSGYAVYYHLPEKVLRFSAAWRDHLLTSLFGFVPDADQGWISAEMLFPHFQVRLLPDDNGGVLLIRRHQGEKLQVLLTATHAPYDPHTLDLTLHALRHGLADAALINLGFSGREPLTDGNLAKLKGWGIPMNPSNIDAIYPYADAHGHPFCYKLEERLPALIEQLQGAIPQLIIDLHGCVGTFPADERLIVGLGGTSPYSRLSALGTGIQEGESWSLQPQPLLGRGLQLLRSFSQEIHVQFCTSTRQGFSLRLDNAGVLQGHPIDLSRDIASLLPGESRTWLPALGLRWLPGSRGNALQRRMARKIDPQILCLHVEVPTTLRRRIARHGLLPAPKY
jgi:hypothetical protein